MRMRGIFGLCLALLCAPVHAHKPSDSYLSLRLAGDTVQGRWDIAVRDLDFVLDLDTAVTGRGIPGRLDMPSLRTVLSIPEILLLAFAAMIIGAQFLPAEAADFGRKHPTSIPVPPA